MQGPDWAKRGRRGTYSINNFDRWDL